MYFTSKNSALAAVLAFAGANAHMLMAEPKPFTTPALQNGPISTVAGRAFPCQVKAGGDYAGTPTKMPLGSTQKLSFIGQATHGGGSCQISVSYDTKPTKESVWKVIHSIEGGCVADVPGNMGNSATAPDPFTFQFPIPKDIPAGKATVAWSWLNRIGNREFYMNCAPVELTGSGGSKSAYDSLPDMLVTNVDGKNACNTVEGSDYKYPNPGKSVERKGPANRLIQLQCAAGTPGGQAGSSPSTPSTPSTPSSPAQPPASSPSKPATGGGSNGNPGSGNDKPGKAPGGVFAPAPSDAPSAPSAPAPSAPAPSAPAASEPAAPAKPAPTTPGSGSGAPKVPSTGSGSGSGSGAGSMAAGSACSPEGQWNCVGGKSYQLCGSGVWSVAMPLAAGTSCTPGQGSSLSMASVGRRAAAFRA